MRLKYLCLFLVLLLASPTATRRTPTDGARDGGAAVERFLTAVETPLSGAVTRRRLVATTRSGSMSGWLDACTYTDGGAMRYRIVAQGGSASVRRRALIAALDGEVKARRDGDPARAALSPRNYEFGPEPTDAGTVRVRLTPRRKDSMLIDGSMLLASDTGDLLSVEGRLIKAPSFWTRRVDVTRRYTRIGGVRVPSLMESQAQVRILGASTFSMSYEYASINGTSVASASAETAACLSAGATAGSGAAEHHQRGVAAHLRRALDEASAEYEAALRLDPPRPPTAAERALVQRLRPRVMTTASEPFALRDVAAVMHPRERLIAFHLLWDDDIDHPDDNDPSDHEVVWVGFTADGRFDRLWTYFHGRVLDGGIEARADAAAHGGRAAVLVQWGKHGSMPLGWRAHRIQADSIETEAGYNPTAGPITLERYNQGTYEKLQDAGARLHDHPLARLHAWPRFFRGSWSDFSQFPRSVDVDSALQRGGMILVSRWNSATLNQRFLRYNFKPKLEWPSDAAE